jgi:hypothetical protein
MVTRVLSPGALRKPLESKIQEQVFEWSNYYYVAGVEGKLRDYMFANMNGTQVAGNSAQRARYINALKKRGLTPGVSDITVALPRGKYHGMYLELKRDNSCDTTEDQDDFLARMRKVGYYAEVAHSFNQAIEMIAGYISLGEFYAKACNRP